MVLFRFITQVLSANTVGGVLGEYTWPLAPTNLSVNTAPGSALPLSGITVEPDAWYSSWLMWLSPETVLSKGSVTVASNFTVLGMAW